MLNDVSTRHCARAGPVVLTLALSCLGAVASGWGQSFSKPTPGQATFNIFIAGTPAGIELVDLSRTTDGWAIRSSGRISSPINLENQHFEVEYDNDWQPIRFSINAIRSGETFSLETTFDERSATSIVQQRNMRTTNRLAVEPDVVILPNYFFASYEAMAVRLSETPIGEELPVYVTAQEQTTARVNQVLTQQIEIAQKLLTARIYRITFQNPRRPLDAEIWVDESHRLLRVSLPAAGLEVARQDVTLVSTRLTGVTHLGDEAVQVQSSGFSLAATVTTPVNHETPPDGRWPAVLLVPGSGVVDRDETIFGIPIFGQLANALADAGYLVMRYDKRGVGQSGGRIESATIEDYANDAREMVKYLNRRDDVDRDRIVVVGHSEGGWVSLLAASRERRIAALAMLAVPGTSGAELALEQQRTALDLMQTEDIERQEKVALQQHIQDAVLGKGPWDGIPENLRRQADTAWFRSFLEFEPAELIRKTRQPLLIVQGELDRQVLPHHADRLEELAGARTRRESTVEVVRLPGINHLLVPAETGNVDEYSRLWNQTVSPDVVSALTGWIERTLEP